MLKPSAIADRIVGWIADGRMTYPLVESVGYWIAQYSAGSEAESKILALAHSIIENIKDIHDRHQGT